MWKQRAKQQWLREGDRNTRFFQAAVKHRRNKNKIIALKNSIGDWHTSQCDMNGIIESYFHDLFRGQDRDDTHKAAHSFLTNVNLPKLSSEQFDSLILPITKMEVETAIFQMDGNKAPSPDGFPISFFQHYWQLVEQDVYAMVHRFFHRGFILKELNLTNLVLIVKKECPETPGDFRPISLCNVTYRIISKVLANRLKDVIPSLISKFQNAFVKGRNISDNIILAGEMLHTSIRKRDPKSSGVVIRLTLLRPLI